MRANILIIVLRTAGDRGEAKLAWPPLYKSGLHRHQNDTIEFVVWCQNTASVCGQHRQFTSWDSQAFYGLSKHDALLATDPNSETFLLYEKLKPLAEPAKVPLYSTQLAVSKDEVQTHQPNATTLSVMQDVVGNAMPTVKHILSLARTFGASSATLGSSFLTLGWIVTAYGCSVLHSRKADWRLTHACFWEKPDGWTCGQN